MRAHPSEHRARAPPEWYCGCWALARLGARPGYQGGAGHGGVPEQHGKGAGTRGERRPQRSSRAAQRRESGGRGRPRRIRRGARVRGQGERRPGASPRIRRVRGNGGEEEGGDDATQGMQSSGEGLRRWRSGPASRGGRPSGRRHRRGIRGGGIVGSGGVVAIGAARGAVEGEGDGSVRWRGTEPTRAATCAPGAATGSSPPRSRSGVRGERT